MTEAARSASQETRMTSSLQTLSSRVVGVAGWEGSHATKGRRALRFAVLVGLGLALAACAGPLGATRVDPTVAQRDVARSAISTGDPSWPTRNVLFEHGLFDA